MLILVRLASEVATKSNAVRSRFQQRLVTNIQMALKEAGVRGKVRNNWGRLFVEADSSLALPVLRRIPGIASISPVDKVCSTELDEIVRVGKELYSQAVQGKTFAVRAHRATTLPYSSKDVEWALGGELKSLSAGVSLDHPEVRIELDLREQGAFFLSKTLPGAGGLPLGTGGHAVALISGGFDSSVAAWLTLKRGVTLDYVFCNLAGESYERSVLGVAHFLAKMWTAGHSRIHVVNIEDIVGNIREKVTNRYAQVVLKRMFYRIGEAVAKEVRGEAIVTGEAIAQVSSQTLTNLTVIDRCIETLVLRPLIGFDKNEIINLTRYLGTYSLCAPIQEYCSITPKKPATRSRLDVIELEEQSMDMTLINKALAEKKVFVLKDLLDSELNLPDVFTDAISEGDSVLDVRPLDQYEMWHFPGAVRIDMEQVLKEARRLPRDRRYVVYCALGVQSAHAAEKMRSLGLDAYSLRGGSKKLRDLQEKVED